MEVGNLFSLVPKTSMAVTIVGLNPKYHNIVQGTGSLTFRADHKSVMPGSLLSIGSLGGFNDVRLLATGFARVQCFFLLLPSGELMLEDTTSGHHTHIDWCDENGKQEKYSLQGDPRRRVIPLAHAESITISFGTKASFGFFWEVSLDASDIETTKQELGKIANANAVCEHAMLEVPVVPDLEALDYERRTENTPIVPPDYDGKPLRETHAYKSIGRGAFGTVTQSVDLGTGLLWAVKECTSPKRGQSWKAEFKSEVEKLACISHPNLIRLEHHQGWSEDRPVQLFFPLCKGSVKALLMPHQCKVSTQDLQPWVLNLIDQALAGLAWMHQNGMVHRDLKPDNILYDETPDGNEKTFYISDFGLVSFEDSLKGVAGTTAYLAPESTRYAESSIASDVYSFGMLFLEAIGKYCPDEAFFHERDWQDKLCAYDVENYRDYRDYLPSNAYVPVMQAGHSRVKSLCDFDLLHPCVYHMLDEDPKRRTTAAEARRELLEGYGVLDPGPSVPVPVIEQRPAQPPALEAPTWEMAPQIVDVSYTQR